MAEEVSSPFEPTHTQWVTIYAVELYVVVLLISWNLKYARSAIFPFKLLTVALHESCHAITGTITGAKVLSIQLDPNQGGATEMEGGWPFLSLPAGYIGSTFIGAALIFAGFDQKASKIAAFPLLFFMCLVCWWARKDVFTLCNVTFSMGIIAALFIIEHAAYLRFFILFQGVMNVMVRRNRVARSTRSYLPTDVFLNLTPQRTYTVWDILDDLVFQKIDESDCSAFTREYPWMPSQAWGTIWLTFALSGLTAGVLGGLVLFKDNFEEQYLNSLTFLAT